MKKQTYRGTLKSLSETGEFTAVIATMNIVDKDGDMIRSGAIPQETKVKIASWGHKWQDLPIGRGTLHEAGNAIMVKGKFFLDTEAGKETYKTVKNLGELQEWSFGFDVVDSHTERIDGKTVRILDKLDVYEVSPVLIGAGVGTRTTDIKNRKGKPQKPWRLDALDQMVKESDQEMARHVKRKADRDFAKSVIRELENMKKDLVAEALPRRPIDKVADTIQRQNPGVTRQYAIARARDHFLGIARQRVINRGIDPHINLVALQNEEDRILRWAYTPQEG
jgi:HK97 family phage prohead protease